METFNANKNYLASKKRVGYLPRREASTETYSGLGFKCGLEVHQQLGSQKKLFCRCPVGRYQDFEDYDAEIIRHMRPTLSELGEYDGTALMEFKTRKEIIYRVKTQNTCTYEIDDTPPFVINKEALRYAMEMALLLKTNIVGELHITRKQYLDGSIPAGFQRTAIVGIEGEIPLRNKKVKIIQISIEEDACREVSDLGHRRVYTTDRLGTPLMETVTYPTLLTPDEAAEAGQYIRFLARSTGHARFGIGAGRQDVNVSISGSTRVEIKGVSHISWIPELTHVEAFRHKALLEIKQELQKRGLQKNTWQLKTQSLHLDVRQCNYAPLKEALESKKEVFAVTLPQFKGILSFFTQPGKSFTDEISDRLKVIACIEKPNLLTPELLDFQAGYQAVSDELWQEIGKECKVQADDALLLLFCEKDDKKTAIETIEERCRMAFDGVPSETRKSFADGTTCFERVLPGADRMYPDTDSAPISITEELITDIRQGLPVDLEARLNQLETWEVPVDTYHYLLRNNLMPVIEKIVNELGYTPIYVATLFGHQLKRLEGTIEPASPFGYEKVYELLDFVKSNGYTQDIVSEMLPIVYRHPKMEFNSVLVTCGYKKSTWEQIVGYLPHLRSIFAQNKNNDNQGAEGRWIMGKLRNAALGNVPLSQLRAELEKLGLGV